MRNIIVGYNDPSADAENSQPLLSGDGGLVLFTEAEFEKSKSLHRFPAGVKQLKMFEVREIENSIFIGANVGEELEKSTALRDAAAAEAAKITRAQTAAQKTIADARALVQTTARARNDLMGRLHSAKSKLAAHDATPETLRGKLHNGTVAELQKLILGEPEKKIAGLETQVAEATAAYDKASAALAGLLKPANEAPAGKNQINI